MDHLNDNLMCIVFIRVNGPTQMVELVISPLDGGLQYSKKFPLLHLYIKPSQLATFQEPEKRSDNPFCCALTEYQHAANVGMDEFEASDIAASWFESLNLRLGKQILPVTYSWDRQRPYLVEFLGPKTTKLWFSTQVRDISAYACVENDKAGFHVRDYPFPKTNLTFILERCGVIATGIPTALNAARCIRDAYEKIIKNEVKGPPDHYHVFDQ